jgi:hypothetical protein
LPSAGAVPCSRIAVKENDSRCQRPTGRPVDWGAATALPDMNKIGTFRRKSSPLEAFVYCRRSDVWLYYRYENRDLDS